MPEKYFLIGIGGTGMRCVEAFTHLCAIGMFDNKEINILTIDTDTNNGNKDKTTQLIDRYIRIKGGAQGTPTSNTFFTAKLNIWKFAPEYSDERLTYELISKLNDGTEQEKKDNKALTDLFFDKDLLQFSLNHGYRAQTHLGSHLMYHCIIEAAKNVRDGRARPQDRDLCAFLDKIQEAGENARIFILGSIFGGTGASSIPIIPKAFQDAIKMQDPKKAIDPGAKFGCVLLTDYFGFRVPDGAQKKEQKIIADSNNFSLNSQAALMFYVGDLTVKKTYNKMYHVGWPKHADFSQGNPLGKTITGGAEQKNPSHVVELLCACAAYDFFNIADGLENKEDDIDIVYKSANFQNDSFLFDFQDFFGDKKGTEFMKRLGALFAFSFIVLNSEKGALGENGTKNLANRLKENNILDYEHLPDEDANDINEFVKLFSFTYDGRGNVVPGWLFQVRQSVDNPFLFNTDAFSTDQKKLQHFHFGKLFTEEKHQFANSKFSISAKNREPYQAFRDMIQNDQSVRPDPNDQKVTKDNEKFLAHSYKTLVKLFNFI